jgi:hypothetical protein
MRIALLYVIVALLLLLVLVQLTPGQELNKKTSTTSEYEYDESDYGIERSETTTTTTASTKDYSNSGGGDDDYYSDYNEEDDYDGQDEGAEDSSDEHQPPFQCPMQCKCIFKRKRTNDYLKVRRRRAGENSTTDTDYDGENYDADYEEDAKVASKQSSNAKYEISIDCSAQGLQSISNLFDYDFPLEQIVKL